MSYTIVYIHGANATPNSFNYIRQHIGRENDIVLSYNSQCGFMRNLDRMQLELRGCERMVFVAHSLGGIYALYLANHMAKQVQHAITLSTPYGGSEPANILKWLMPHNQLFYDIATTGLVIKTAANLPITHPWCNIVTTGGINHWFGKPNDGVVSIDSMQVNTNMDLVKMDVNHYEVMMYPPVVSIIKERLTRYS
jgi:hypothetical protein